MVAHTGVLSTVLFSPSVPPLPADNTTQAHYTTARNDSAAATRVKSYSAALTLAVVEQPRSVILPEFSVSQGESFRSLE